jgi:hypothetical protein
VLESDAKRMVDNQRRQLAEGTTSHISSGLAGLLNKVPGVRIAYQAPAQNDGDKTTAV